MIAVIPEGLSSQIMRIRPCQNDNQHRKHTRCRQRNADDVEGKLPYDEEGGKDEPEGRENNNKVVPSLSRSPLTHELNSSKNLLS